MTQYSFMSIGLCLAPSTSPHGRSDAIETETQTGATPMASCVDQKETRDSDPIAAAIAKLQNTLQSGHSLIERHQRSSFDSFRGSGSGLFSSTIASSSAPECNCVYFYDFYFS